MVMKNVKDLEVGRYVQFQDMKELVSIMKRHPKVWSWGANNFTSDRNIFLKFDVNGHLFKGQVVISVNGLDLFEVFLVGPAGEISDEILNVYIDELIDVIDEKVEKISGYKW
jgi:hypothetical protein